MLTESPSSHCPLCFHSQGSFFYQDVREFYRCPDCLLVFVPPSAFPSRQEERAEYDKHRNSPEDLGYRRFLSRLFEPLTERLPPGSRGLDFGAGPGPTLSLMFEEAGHHQAIYDPFYAPDPAPLSGRYGFITASEVVEHLHHPRRELDHLWSLLLPGGWLGLMTKRVLDRQAFARWHYKSDPTHVCFFSLETFSWLADLWNAELLIAGKDVVLLRKPSQPHQSINS